MSKLTIKPLSSIDLLGMHRTVTNKTPVKGIDEELIFKKRKHFLNLKFESKV